MMLSIRISTGDQKNVKTMYLFVEMHIVVNTLML